MEISYSNGDQRLALRLIGVLLRDAGKDEPNIPTDDA